MPEMNGVEFLRSYLAQTGIPVVMISSVSVKEGPLVMEALSLGALTYIQKPSVDKLETLGPPILETLENLSRHHHKISKPICTKTRLNFNDKDGLIVIGSSTGGTQALQRVFTELPDLIPPIVVVQHIPAVFSKALADRLNSLTRFEVKEAVDEEILAENNIYIAPGGKHLKLIQKGVDSYLKVTDDAPINRFKPSVDYLFDSVKEIRVKKVVGVILTGMGKDGAQGLLGLKKDGHKTIAQDEETSIVFGMPKEAIKIGATDIIRPIDKIAEEIVIQYNKIK